MENIIQQIALDLVEKITKKAFEAKISDIDTLASDVLADCKTAACEILEAAVAQLNESIRKEKATRKELGLILKEKNRKRSILTELGTLNLPRDYFFDKTCDRYVFVLDAMLGLQRYERISGNVRTRLVTEACRSLLCQKRTDCNRRKCQPAKCRECDPQAYGFGERAGLDRKEEGQGTPCVCR